MTSTLRLSNELTVSGADFATGLSRALNAVVEIIVNTKGLETRCTGWLIAPQLVVAPAYGLRSGRYVDKENSIVVRSATGEDWYDSIDPASPVERLMPGGLTFDPGSDGLAVFRLKSAHPAPRIAFRLDAPAAHEMLLMMHYGLGNNLSEPRLSFTELTSTDDNRISYLGEPLVGSGGAVLYDMQWRFLGVHLLSTQELSHGIAHAAVMAALQQSRWWKVIAQHQGFANVAAALAKNPTPDRSSTPHSPVLMRAALSFSINPELLSLADREALMPHVVDVDAPRWSLTFEARRNVLASAPLASFMQLLPDAPDSLEQKIIAPILRGGPYSLEQATEEELAHWLQAARWFADFVPELPTPKSIHRLLQYRRVRGRLSRIAGRDFVGRTNELARMQAWFNSRSTAPLNIWGIGGIGKSALVAHFLTSLPTDTLLLWLDFDRADLAPDNAASIISALLEQAEIQSAELTPPIPNAHSQIDAHAPLDSRRDALVKLLTADKSRRIVIVLDSFEAAQYAERYQELWPELEKLGKRVNGIQLIVSGRAPQRNLEFLNVPVEEIGLSGLEPETARDWLSRHGVPRGKTQEEVVHAAGGMPLVLKLAEQLILAGGRLENLPKKMVAGVLYDRILNRIHRPEFKDVAKGAIVVRRLSQEMVVPLFENLLRLPGRPTSVWFREFARESSLFEGDEALRLRPEVRVAALALLERDQPTLVENIERRALAWYETCDINDPVVAAERVYHFLRLGNEDMALDAWREGCAKYLQHAEETLHGDSKEWLLHRLGASASIFDADVKLWELDAADRLFQSRAKGQFDLGRGILSERADRSGAGILAFQEGYELWRDGHTKSALDLLLRYDVVTPGAHSRQRAMLAALMHAELGQRREALNLLLKWRSIQHWRDRKSGVVECAAVHAALVCLQSPVALERSLHAEGAFNYGLLPMDFLMRETWKRLRTPPMPAVIELPRGAPDSNFLVQLANYRVNVSARPSKLQTDWLVQTWKHGTKLDALESFEQHAIKAVLVASGWRWSLLAEEVMLAVFEEALRTPAIRSLNQSVITVLGLFAHIPGLRLRRNGALFDVLLDELRSKFIYQLPAEPTFKDRKGVDKLRYAALRWCEGDDIRPLRQLVHRFAGRREESFDDMA